MPDIADLTAARLVNKDVMLGMVRELEPPQDHIGLSLLPLENVNSDEVIWDSVKGLTAGLAPARSMDAESELAQKDEVVGTGKASIIDWAVKDRWNASDVMRYREITAFAGADSLPRTIGAITGDWETRMARAALKRRRQLDNRLEWLCWSAIEGTVTYSDGRIAFSVDYGIPGGQKNVAPATTWDQTTADPIGNVLAWRETVRNNTGVELRRAVTSRKVLFNVMNNSKFAQMFSGQNPFYMFNNRFGIQQATETLANATDMEWYVYDASYRTRPFGSTAITNTRFNNDKKVYLFPGQGEVINYSGYDNGLGLGSVLTSPHPEGNFTPGFYEWEQDRKDPWGYDQGTGIKAFPVIYQPDVLFNATVLP